MKNVGVVCDLKWARNSLFKNFYFSIDSLYSSVKVVSSNKDLDGLDILFVYDNFYAPNKAVINQAGFTDRCNELEIQVVVFITERIFDSFWPRNVKDYNSLRNFNYLHCYMLDVDDCIKTGAKHIHLPISKQFKDIVKIDVNDKMDKIVFIGQTIYSYDIRRETLSELRGLMPVDVFASNVPTWEEYLKLISKYRFVLCLKGNCNAFSLRIYDSLLVGSIPIQQVVDNTLLPPYFDIEAKFDDCIFFQKANELPDKIKKFTLKGSHNEFWAEDYYDNLLKEDGFL